MKTQRENIRTIVKEQYAEAARTAPSSEAACCDGNYSSTELSAIPTESVLGLGSGNPVRHADLKSGEWS